MTKFFIIANSNYDGFLLSYYPVFNPSTCRKFIYLPKLEFGFQFFSFSSLFDRSIEFTNLDPHKDY